MTLERDIVPDARMLILIFFSKVSLLDQHSAHSMTVFLATYDALALRLPDVAVREGRSSNNSLPLPDVTSIPLPETRKLDILRRIILQYQP